MFPYIWIIFCNLWIKILTYMVKSVFILLWLIIIYSLIYPAKHLLWKLICNFMYIIFWPTLGEIILHNHILDSMSLICYSLPILTWLQCVIKVIAIIHEHTKIIWYVKHDYYSANIWECSSCKNCPATTASSYLERNFTWFSIRQHSAKATRWTAMQTVDLCTLKTLLMTD